MFVKLHKFMNANARHNDDDDDDDGEGGVYHPVVGLHHARELFDEGFGDAS